MHNAKKDGMVGEAGRVRVSKFVCDAAGTGTKAD